jgi:prepilin-type N-terminal cleavage/methylation domain-containing protein
MKIFNKTGFTLVEIMIIIAILGLLASIAIPTFVRVRQERKTEKCINNLRLIDATKEQYAIEKKLSNGAKCTIQNVDSYIKEGVTNLYCSCDKDKSFKTSYTINDIGTDPECKIVKNHKL